MHSVLIKAMIAKEYEYYLSEENKMKKWDEFEEKIYNFLLKAIIPVAVLWGITGIIAVIVNALGI